MSELKAFNSERIYWAAEQVERVAGDIDELHLDDNLFYLKSEADKVIADLEESHKKEVGQLLMEIAELKNKINESQTELELWRDGSIISEAHQKELDGKQHSDYKRCLAMARWCRTSARCDEGLGAFKYRDWYWKWFKRWLAIADKFKEAK